MKTLLLVILVLVAASSVVARLGFNFHSEAEPCCLQSGFENVVSG